MRSSYYDFMPSSIQELGEKVKRRDNIILKSENPEGFTQYNDLEQEIEQVSKRILAQFYQLRDDFYKGEIVEVRYKEYLKHLKDLYDQGLKLHLPEITVPGSIADIANEVSRYL